VGAGQVILVRVALAPPPARIVGVDWEQQQIDAIKEAETYLADVAAKLGTRVAVKTNAPYGHAVREILDTVEAVGADAVVMATHGRTGLAHLVYGSVAEAVLAESPVPVFLVHAMPGEAPAPPFNPSSARALVPLDGLAFAEAALHTAANLVGPAGELVLACVVEPPDHVARDQNGRVLAYLDQQEEAVTREARDYLAQVATGLAQSYPWLRVSTTVRIGEAASGIVTAAVDRDADVVVMASHGRTGVLRAVIGSVAGAVLRKGSTPVLLVGPHESHQPIETLVAQSSRT